MAIGKKVTITNEDRAWALLQQALSGESVPDGIDLKIGELQGIHIHVKGVGLNGTIPGRYLPALTEYQDSIHRLYSFIKYKEYSVRRLTDEDRQATEVVYKVKRGSSSFNGDLIQILEKFAVEAASKMNGQQLLIFLCVLVVTLAGAGGLKMWLNYKKEKLGSDQMGAAVQALSSISQTLAQNQREDPEITRQKLKLLKKAMKSSKAAKLAFEAADASNTRLALSMSPTDKLVLNGVEIDGEELRRAATAPREQSKTFDEVGPAVLTSVDNSVGDGYAIGVKFLSSSSDVTARVENNRLTDEELRCLANAVLTRAPVHVHVDGKWHRGSVVAGRILSIRDLSEVEIKALQKKFAEAGSRIG